VSAVTEQWRQGGRLVTGWDVIIKNPVISIPYGWVVYGTDARRTYRSIRAVGQFPDGSRVLDVPCGGGVAFRALRPDRPLRYVAADVSPVMLARAREEAAARKLDWIELCEADVEALPFDDDEFDHCVTYWGLHCFPDPALAVREMTRVLRPGGELRGNTVVKGAPHQNALIALWQRLGIFEAVHDREALRGWLVDAGLEQVSVDRSGAIAFFSGRKPEG
jgi:SAM-dependent methyltransferase